MLEDLSQEEKKKIVDSLPKPQREEFELSFSYFDKNGDGSISKQELETVMRSLGQNPTKEELESWFKKADSDGDEKVGRLEFLYLMACKLRNGIEDQGLLEAFKILDQDGDNMISKQDIMITMNYLGEQLTEKDMDDLFRNADLDKDQQLDFQEFVTMISKQI